SPDWLKMKNPAAPAVVQGDYSIAGSDLTPTLSPVTPAWCLLAPDEIRPLRRLQHEQPPSSPVFMTDRHGPAPQSLSGFLAVARARNYSSNADGSRTRAFDGAGAAQYP